MLHACGKHVSDAPESNARAASRLLPCRCLYSPRLMMVAQWPLAANQIAGVLGAVAVYMLSTVDCIELVQAERTLLTLICRAYVCRQDDGPLSSRERCRVR
eukprot:18695-Heterococcus_DN1.PRE.5